MAKKSRSSSVAFTVLSILAIALCIRLGFWQFDRYEIRHQLTRDVSAAMANDAVILNGANQGSASSWMKVAIDGKYDKKFQSVFRGHYFQERYGLEVLSLFIPNDDQIPPIWVDRGWIQTTKDAATPEVIPAPPEGVQRISGILRQYDDPKASRGLFFALPTPRIGRIDELSLQRTYSGETFNKYLKLQNQAGDSEATLETAPITAPGEGPHLAYAIQWWLFAILIAGTRIALFKGERK